MSPFRKTPIATLSPGSADESWHRSSERLHLPSAGLSRPLTTMAVHVDVPSIDSAPRLHASTSRTSLEDVEDGAKTRRNDKPNGWAIDSVARDKLYGEPRRASQGKGKGKEPEWTVELDVVDGNGPNRKTRPSDVSATDEGSDRGLGAETEDSDGSSLSTAEGIDSFARRDGQFSSDKASDGLRPLPPPAPPPPVPPKIPRSPSPKALAEDPAAAAASPSRSLPPPILKRPQPARLHSSTTSEPHTLSFSPSLPGSLSRTVSPSSPSLLTSYAPHLPHSSLESPPATSSDSPVLLTPPKEIRHPIFSPLDRRSTVGDDKEIGAGSGATSSATHGFDPTATIRSWKSSLTARKNPDKKRLAALGFEEELQRDYDFWASFGISLCNIGGLPGEPPLPHPRRCTLKYSCAHTPTLGTVLGVLTALQTGGGSMYAIAWPLSGLFMCAIAAILGEMVSTWPVAGAMFTWVFRLSRSIKGLDPWARYLSWMTGSFLLCSHILLQVRSVFIETVGPSAR